MAKPEDCAEVRPWCNLSSCSIEQAALRIGAAFIYEVRVAPRNLIYAKKLLRDLMLQTVNNPLSPYFNLLVEPEFVGDEWAIRANGTGCWSPNF